MAGLATPKSCRNCPFNDLIIKHFKPIPFSKYFTASIHNTFDPRKADLTYQTNVLLNTGSNQDPQFDQNKTPR